MSRCVQCDYWVRDNCCRPPLGILYEDCSLGATLPNTDEPEQCQLFVKKEHWLTEGKP